MSAGSGRAPLSIFSVKNAGDLILLEKKNVVDQAVSIQGEDQKAQALVDKCTAECKKTCESAKKNLGKICGYNAKTRRCGRKQAKRMGLTEHSPECELKVPPDPEGGAPCRRKVILPEEVDSSDEDIDGQPEEIVGTSDGPSAPGSDNQVDKTSQKVAASPVGAEGYPGDGNLRHGRPDSSGRYRDNVGYSTGDQYVDYQGDLHAHRYPRDRRKRYGDVDYNFSINMDAEDNVPDAIVDRHTMGISPFAIPGSNRYFIPAIEFKRILEREPSMVIVSQMPSRVEGNFVLKLQPYREIDPAVSEDLGRKLAGFWEPAPTLKYDNRTVSLAMDQISPFRGNLTRAIEMRDKLLESETFSDVEDVRRNFYDVWEEYMLMYSPPFSGDPAEKIKVRQVYGSGLNSSLRGLVGQWTPAPPASRGGSSSVQGDGISYQRATQQPLSDIDAPPELRGKANLSDSDLSLAPVPHESKYIDVAHQYELNAARRGIRGGFMHRVSGTAIRPRQAMAMIKSGQGNLVDNGAFAARRAAEHAARIGLEGRAMPHSPHLPASARAEYAEVIENSGARQQAYTARASANQRALEDSIGNEDTEIFREYMRGMEGEVH